MRLQIQVQRIQWVESCGSGPDGGPSLASNGSFFRPAIEAGQNVPFGLHYRQAKLVFKNPPILQMGTARRRVPRTGQCLRPASIRPWIRTRREYAYERTDSRTQTGRGDARWRLSLGSDASIPPFPPIAETGHSPFPHGLRPTGLESRSRGFVAPSTGGVPVVSSFPVRAGSTPPLANGKKEDTAEGRQKKRTLRRGGCASGSRRGMYPARSTRLRAGASERVGEPFTGRPATARSARPRSPAQAAPFPSAAESGASQSASARAQSRRPRSGSGPTRGWSGTSRGCLP